jgi:hypothetical protein
MRFGTGDMRSLYRLGSIIVTVVRYKLDLVGVQEVRWDKGGTARVGDYTFVYGKE